MRRIIVFISLISCFLCCQSQYDPLRVAFFNATESGGKKSLYSLANSMDCNLPVLVAYLGVATAMQADVVSSVGDKIDFFNAGKELLEAAVVADSFDCEIRYLRFSVQCEVPFFLGYSGKLDDDATLIVNALINGSVDSKNWFWQLAMKSMIESGELKKEQENKLKSLVNIESWK